MNDNLTGFGFFPIKLPEYVDFANVSSMIRPKKIYLIGSLRNRKKVMAFANKLRKQGFEVFDDWTSPGEFADIHLWKYYKQRGFTYEQMIQSHAARNNYLFDRKHLDEADCVVLYGKGGKSAHLELGYSSAKKPSFLFLEKPPVRPDIMYAFLYDSGGGIFFDKKKLFEAIRISKFPENKQADHSGICCR